MSSFDVRLAQWFEHRRWRVRTELTGEVTEQGCRIAYRSGAFEIDPPGAYATPFGVRGRKGILIERVGDAGDEPSQAAFGLTVLRRAHAAFGTIDGLPEEDG